MLTKTEVLQNKIVDLHKLKQLVKKWKLHSQKVGFTNGCFDLLHVGHIKVLTEAASYSNKLIVALNTDQSVQLLKGPHRPINKEQDRATLLSALEYVDAIILFDEETPLQLIETLQPDVLVKGGDYTIETIVGASSVLANNGEVYVVPTKEGYATTQLIQQIKNN